MSTEREIFKYEIPVDDQWHKVTMPAPAKVVHVACPDGARSKVTLWAEVTLGGEVQSRAMRAFGTGQTIPGGAVYVGTAITAPFVWHVYAEGIS